ncbi:MAG: hypothetical protein ABJB16_16440 [Saprospiraceae bacterium]
MKTSRFQIITVLLALVVMVGGGCYYDNVIFPEGPSITGDVFFAPDVVPIFTKDCSLSGCHIPGGQTPDLSASNAYSSLINGNFINTSSPKESELYLWMQGLETLPMPPSGSKPTETAIVLAWIEQGAQNN